MNEWAAKRFWKTTATTEAADGFGIELDGRPVKTPAKAPLIVPTAALASAIAAEWDAQQDKIDPLTMPVTRGANAAIDKVATQKSEVVALLAAYGDSDLLCYRAAGPAALIAEQKMNWDPLLDWADATYGVRLRSGEGVMHVAQDADGLARLTAELDQLSPFELAAAHDLISLSGSLIIGLAVMRGYVAAPRAWAVSRVDEEWQISQWGEDEEARAQEMLKSQAFENAARFFEMCQN